MSAYYNEFDPFAAEWLRELMKDGLIADGEVDERSIEDVAQEDIRGFTQCHFFAGIGGWSLAARLAGWGDDRPMWTGSPPCQPFSSAGNRKGKDDLRHLWPVFFNLIRECQPPVVFGEQVASAIRMGWFDDLQADLEAEGYASAMAVLPACSVGAPHKRDRLFYAAQRMGDARRFAERPERLESFREGSGEKEKFRAAKGFGSPDRGEASERLANPDDGRQSGQRELRRPSNSAQDGDREVNRTVDAGALSNFWEGSDYIYCRDGKNRQVPVEPSLFPLVNGVSNRVGLLRGAGNAIVPQVGAEVIRAFMEK